MMALLAFVIPAEAGSPNSSTLNLGGKAGIQDWIPDQVGDDITD